MAIGWQKCEGALVLLAAMLVIFHLDPDLPIWAMALIFFAPDLSFAGYLAGPKIGAITYNTVHLYAGGALLTALALRIGSSTTLTLGLLWLGHAGFDRMLGYGLKLPSGFKHTHLGEL
ncbi:DUF4260 family protein [Paracoccaceae bacterium GXU_MW_L88]